MNKDIDYGVFVVDDLDECSAMSKTTSELNDKFEDEVIAPKIEMMNNWQCPCCLGRAKAHKAFNPKGTVAVMDHKGNITDKAVEDVSVGEMVLEPLDGGVMPFDADAMNDRPDLFDYTAIVHSTDNEYKDLVCIIRHCTNCGDIKINGDLDAITKVIGMGFMNNLDYETKCAEAEHPEDDGESCGCECSGCSGCHCDDGEPDSAVEEVSD